MTQALNIIELSNNKEINNTSTEKIDIESGKFDAIFNSNLNQKSSINELEESNNKYTSSITITDFKEILESGNETEVTDDNSIISNTTTFEQALAIPSINNLVQILKNENKNSNNSTVESEIDLTQNEVVFEEETIEVGTNLISKNNNNSENYSEDEESTFEEGMLKELNIKSIKADTYGSNNNDSMQNQTPQEQAVKIMLNQDIKPFDINNIQQTEIGKNTNIVQQVNSNKIIEQITKQMNSLTNNAKVNIIMEPASLGKVTIQLIRTSEGLTAEFTAMTEEARESLMNGINGLKESLLSHGVSVNDISVKLNNTEKASTNEEWTQQEGSRGGNKNSQQRNKDEKAKEHFEKMLAQNNKKNGEV